MHNQPRRIVLSTHTAMRRCFPSIVMMAALASVGLAAEPSKQPLDPVDQLAKDLEPTRKVVYKRVGGQELLLHIFEPEGHRPTDRRACFIAIHGG
ncbi:MAG: hypothetical protein ABFD16_18480, partial [Thermoguttaceae bacterium]